MEHFIVFDSNVWGTISDWFMVIVTSVTAYFLYRTLQSQKNIQQTQAKLFAMESLRFRESIKPKLNYVLHPDTSVFPDKPDKKILTIKITNATENLADEIRVTYNHDNKDALPVFSHPNPKYQENGDQPIYIHFIVDKKPRYHIFFSFAVIYKDVFGTIYKQGVMCIMDYGQIEINPYLPETITSEEAAKLPVI